MDISPQATTQPMSDDQELAKALAGVVNDPEPAAPAAPVATPANTEPPKAEETAPPTATPADSSLPQPTPAPVVPTTPSVEPASAPSSDLDSIKKDALGELRPLIDKVDLPAEEKFDTYLMLIRSTDDKALIAPAHAAALAISDEKRKAQALLDIIKEIDYLSQPPAPAA